MSVIAGDYHGFVIGSEGQVWAFGINDYGLLGLGATSAALRAGGYVLPHSQPPVPPTIIPNLPPIVSINTTEYNTFFVDIEGSVWVAGREFNVYDNILSPKKMNHLNNIVQVSSSHSFALFLDQTGRIQKLHQRSPYPSGLRLPRRIEDVPNELTDIQGLPPVAKIAMNDYRDLVLDREGRVWSWGTGFLGLGPDVRYTDTPTRITHFDGLDSAASPRIVDISLRHRHTLLLDDQGRVWSFGDNFYGQLGLGDINRYEDAEIVLDTNRHIPTLIRSLPRIKAISAESSSSIVLDDEGRVWKFGDDDNLDESAPRPPYIIDLPDPVVEISAAAANLVADVNGQVWSFGSFSYPTPVENADEPRLIEGVTAELPSLSVELLPQVDYIFAKAIFDRIVDFRRLKVINEEQDYLVELEDSIGQLYLLNASYDEPEDKLEPPFIRDDFMALFETLIRDEQLENYDLTPLGDHYQLEFKDRTGQTYLTLVDYDEPSQQIFPFVE